MNAHFPPQGNFGDYRQPRGAPSDLRIAQGHPPGRKPQGQTYVNFYNQRSNMPAPTYYPMQGRHAQQTYGQQAGQQYIYYPVQEYYYQPQPQTQQQQPQTYQHWQYQAQQQQQPRVPQQGQLPDTASGMNSFVRKVALGLPRSSNENSETKIHSEDQSIPETGKPKKSQFFKDIGNSIFMGAVKFFAWICGR